MPVLGMDRRSFGGSRQRLVGLVERHDLRVIDRRHDGIRIETLYPRKRLTQVVVAVQQPRGRELEQLQREQCSLTQARIVLARRDDRAARTRAWREAWLGKLSERHPEPPLECGPPGRLARRRVAHCHVALGRFTQADQYELPLELVPEAPAQAGEGGPRRVGPRASRIGEESRADGQGSHRASIGSASRLGQRAVHRRLTSALRYDGAGGRSPRNGRLSATARITRDSYSACTRTKYLREVSSNGGSQISWTERSVGAFSR